MKNRIFLFIFLVFFLFCSGQIFGWFKAENAPANLSFVVENVEKNEYLSQKIIFVGDMMFDRGVEALMEKTSFAYPVEMIKNFLCTFDFAVGNLEGPINEKPKEFSDESLMFSFDKKVVESLKSGKFGMLSLANNHTLNMGDKGLEETKSILKEDSIAFTGDPIDCDADYISQKDGITFYGVNVTFPNNCSNEEIADWVKETKFYNPETFLVVLVHWGMEYKTESSKEQEDLAHDMIDAGADLIIGSHPHVVQNIEKYKNKLIFYSLGNFIFDQYFSKDTQEGLGVGVEIYLEKKIYSLYAIKNNLSQPKMMEDDEKKVFLEGLAGASSEDLAESIKNGLIEIKD
ncbi:MAG: CapA family protein [Candidatus Paceibacterota bacterium]|jgi:poly-gamma-glutamate synthesis protein (capsule biosynthesis protein)